MPTIDGAVRSHHTAWVHVDGHGRAIPVRYALNDEMLVAFGDGVLRDLATGARTWITVHEIAGGPPLVGFAATVTELAPPGTPRAAVLELLDHVSLGADLATVNRRVDQIIGSRRVIGLAP